MRNKLAYWRYEGWMLTCRWWNRHWWPAHIQMLERERDDWMRWCLETENKLAAVGEETSDETT